MSAPARETASATTALQLALARIGVEVVTDLLSLWLRDIDPVRIDATASAWLPRATGVIFEKRAQVRDLVVSFYRLTRALNTGRTVIDPRAPGGQGVSLGQLRAEFRDRLSDTGVDPAEFETPANASPDGRRIEYDDIGWDVSDEEALDRDAAEEAEVDLSRKGPDNLRNRLEVVDLREPAEKVDQRREEARRKAGARQAAAGERIVRNAARSTMWQMHLRDEAAIGYARFSTTGTPCGWCAMLISRGAAYKTASAARYGEDGDLYHDNCKCIAVPIYSSAQWNDPMFDLNREYQRLWPEVTKGLSGAAARSAWRRFIRARQAQAAAG